MRTYNKILLVLIVISSFISLWAASPASAFSGLGIKRNFNLSNDTAEVNRYTRIALSIIESRKNLKTIKPYIDTAEMICSEKNIEMPALLHLARAEYFFLTGDFNNTSQEASIAMKLATDNNEKKVIIKTMNLLGRYNLRTGSFKTSIDYFESSIKLAKKEGLEGYIPISYNNMSDVYLAIGDINNYRKTLELLINAALKENNTYQIEDGYFRLGTSLTEKKRDFYRADSLLKNCLEISLIKKDTSFIALSLANIGWNYYLEKRYDQAIKAYNGSLSYSIPSKKYGYSANSYGNLGTIYRDIGDTDNSLKYYIKSIEQAKLGNDIYNRSWVYKDMSDMYLQTQDTANAYKTYVLYKQFSDSLTKESNTRGLADARIRYEADSHKKELELLSLKLSKQRLLIYGYTGLFVLSVAIALLIYSRARINARRRMSEMNRKISEVTQANLRQQMNPHFIFNTLNSIQYYMYQHDKLATNNYLTKFSSLMRKVLENSQHTSVPLRDEIDTLNLYLELEKIRFKDKFDYQINIDEEIDTLLYKVPTMLIQPYVENSICHGLMPSEENGLVKIDLKLKKDYISCIIEDNGIGRDASLERKIKNEKNHNSLGTQITNSRLDLVNTLYGTSLKIIYTDLKNESGEPVGTRVEIHIPIMS